MRKLLVALTVGVLGLLLVACTPEEATHLRGVNDFRSANGLPALAWDENLYGPARSWSQQMANAGTLSHPASLSANFLPAPGWHKIGQNVAVASTLDSALTALENSPAHRANLLDRGFTRVAVGVIQQGGRYWITEDFVG